MTDKEGLIGKLERREVLDKENRVIYYGRWVMSMIFVGPPVGSMKWRRLVIGLKMSIMEDL